MRGFSDEVAIMVALASAEPWRRAGDLVWYRAHCRHWHRPYRLAELSRELASGRFRAGMALLLSTAQRSGLCKEMTAGGSVGRVQCHCATSCVSHLLAQAITSGARAKYAVANQPNRRHAVLQIRKSKNAIGMPTMIARAKTRPMGPSANASNKNSIASVHSKNRSKGRRRLPESIRSGLRMRRTQAIIS